MLVTVLIFNAIFNGIHTSDSNWWSKGIMTPVQRGTSRNGSNTVWRRVECVMWDRKLKIQPKGKALEAYTVHASI